MGELMSKTTFALISALFAGLFCIVTADQEIPPQNYGPPYFYPENPAERLYKLPWTSGKSFRTWDGYGSEPGGSHHPDYSVDFGTPEGEPVLAARGGTVSVAYGVDTICNIPTSQGNKVIIMNTDSMPDSTAPSGWRKARVLDLYLHIQKTIPVKAGHKVKQGQLLGYSSCTGQDGGVSHIHFKSYIDNSLEFIGYYVHNGWFDSRPDYFFSSIPTPFVEVTNRPNGLPEQNDYLTSQNELYVSAESPELELDNQKVTLTARPNPFNPVTRFFVKGVKDEKISVKLYSTNGQLISSVFEGAFNESINKGIPFESNKLPAGIYMAKLTTEKGSSSTVRVNLVR
jgi:murein DD-endopeptidase MepM/ murein hydrolase activator NlpD